MSEKTFFRLSGLAAIVSAGLSFSAAVAAILSSFVPRIPDPIVNVALLAANFFIVLALIGFFGVQQKELGTQGLVGFIMAGIGILTTFLVPFIGHLVFLLGLLLFAIANGRRGILPSPAMWLWFSGAFTAVAGSVLGFGMSFALGLTIAASGRAWLGAALWAGGERKIGVQASH